MEREFPSSYKKSALITLIPKPNKDIAEIENYRPLSLMNLDNKSQ